ncbi:MAG TPA: FAD-binding oxidoreductase [Vicinamibacterales bacterium]|nr:FAD-binding oxidoreductase [Vicinamibacterales bacterium]
MANAPAAAGRRLAGWGRVPVVPGYQVRSEDLEALTVDVPLTRGLGRAYGDAALPAPGDSRIAGSTLADRILHFDAQTGEMSAEAGLSLDELYRAFLPRGWFTPVTPGTRFVTLGGMVAADVHGKNHHVDGCFGRHVTALRLRVADGRIVVCSRTDQPELFFATIGGMGLTGHILEVRFRLVRVPSPWIYQEVQRVPDIDAFMDALKSAAASWPMTMGWIDCLSGGPALGRGVLYRGRWAEALEAPAAFPALHAPIPVPFMLPNGLLNVHTARAFNTLLYHQPQAKTAIVHPRSFFYPLDVAADWHRGYGPRGFTQYQCVLPESGGHAAARRFLEIVTGAGGASFLCVIKDCGPEGEGLLSFPKKGISIALDLPMRDDTQALVDRMNETVIAEGGRIYLAKDALTRPEHFRAMETRLDRFLAVRRTWDPDGRIRSAQSVRLFGW